MLREKLVKDLRQFGLTEYEAKAYLALAIHGPLPASSLSNFSKIPQSKIYEVLKSLVNKSLAEYWNGRPIRYRAVQPMFALNKMINKKENDINNLKELSNSLVNKLKPVEKEEHQIWSSKGKRAFLEKASEMLLKSKKTYFSTTERFSRYAILDTAFLKALKRDVKVKILGNSELSGAKRARAAWYANKGAKIKVLPMDAKPSIGLIDKKEVCVRVGDSSHPDFFWSNNSALINISGSYFKELWKRDKTVKF